MSKKNPHAVALSKLGASKGGKARAASMTPERRSEIARQAVTARWAKAKAQKAHSGFEPDDEPDPWTGPPHCRHPEHNPPGHLVIPQGMRYRHVCPGCGEQVILRPGMRAELR